MTNTLTLAEKKAKAQILRESILNPQPVPPTQDEMREMVTRMCILLDEIDQEEQAIAAKGAGTLRLPPVLSTPAKPVQKAKPGPRKLSRPVPVLISPCTPVSILGAISLG
jgi:hypothetical protein